ncbi:MAG: lysine--tRNA ligase [Phycisphaerae bacterium]|nr:lysine--tRNA ligase [Phycisphaerae bacterium]
MLEKVYQDRLANLEKIRDLGVDPYGGRYDSAEAIAEILARFKEDDESQTADAAGRVILMRPMGKLIFAHIRDETGSMQICLRKNALDEAGWSLAGLLDLGDIVAAAGPMIRTRTGEITIFADKLTLLCKSLLPMPEKFHGLVDVETRYRQRYLDLMSNPETMEVARKRIEIIKHIRDTLDGRGFSEVETPMMQSLPGGAAARPFVTHHNALDIDLFLRISPELYLKRLMVGGMEKVFEINRNFRNEGLDSRHNPEFTMLELYQAYADYSVMMEITEELIATSIDLISPLEEAKRHISQAREAQQKLREYIKNLKDLPEVTQRKVDKAVTMVLDPIASAMTSKISLAKIDVEAVKLRKEGKIALPYGDRIIDYTRPWRRATYEELLAEHAGVNMRDASAVREKARELGMEEANKDDAIVINDVFEATVEQHLIQPTFVLDYPADLCPLTRRKADDETLAERFELFIAGMEIANAYTELNDPAVQEANFRKQLAGEADGETMRVMDDDFVASLRHGMPPAGGLGIGIDRVVMLLTGRTTIRDVILFPMLKPEQRTD